MAAAIQNRARKKVPPGGGTVKIITVDHERELKKLANRIHRNNTKFIKATIDWVESVGSDLKMARDMFPSNPQYGKWLRDNRFPWTSNYASKLAKAAEVIGEVRYHVENEKKEKLSGTIVPDKLPETEAHCREIGHIQDRSKWGPAWITVVTALMDESITQAKVKRVTICLLGGGTIGKSGY